MKGKLRKGTASFLAAAMVVSGITVPVKPISAAQEWADALVFTFSDTAITTTDETAEGYAIENTTLTINGAGTYVLEGSSTSGNVVVKKNTKDVVLVLNGLTLASETAPICCNKGTKVELIAAENTVNSLTDAEANSEDEKAVVKSKDGSSLTLSGSGTLNVAANGKNGIKGGAETDIVVKEQTLHITSVDNALASDNSLTIESGTVTIEAAGDGIKSSPDETDTTEDTTTDATESEAVGDVVINGGEYTIEAVGDAIQAEQNLTIADGIFKVKTNGGSATVLSDSSDSCKGLKAGNELTVNGGTYDLNTADDAVHSDQYVTVYGGEFIISTGDDGMHADTSLMIGQEDAELQPIINISKSYEGLEGGTVYVYGGDIDVTASDDGINAAGGSGNGTDPGQPGGDGFNPGGGRPGGAGGPGMGGRTVSQETDALAAGSDYAIYMNGGDVYVNAGGDGLDSNGNLVLNGGKVIVYGAAAAEVTTHRWMRTERSL